MKIATGLDLNYVDGKVQLELALKDLIKPKLDDLRAKIASGELDVVKGTDLEKGPILMAIDFLEAELAK